MALLEAPEAAEFVARLEKVPRAVKRGMMDEGSMMCGFQPDHGLPNHWRFIIPNPRTTEPLIDAALDIIARCVALPLHPCAICCLWYCETSGGGGAHVCSYCCGYCVTPRAILVSKARR